MQKANHLLSASCMVATAAISALAFMAINAILFIFQRAARAGAATARARPSSQADPALIPDALPTVMFTMDTL